MVVNSYESRFLSTEFFIETYWNNFHLTIEHSFFWKSIINFYIFLYIYIGLYISYVCIQLFINLYWPYRFHLAFPCLLCWKPCHPRGTLLGASSMIDGGKAVGEPQNLPLHEPIIWWRVVRHAARYTYTYVYTYQTAKHIRYAHTSQIYISYVNNVIHTAW